jgi:hypothetical protein
MDEERRDDPFPDGLMGDNRGVEKDGLVIDGSGFDGGEAWSRDVGSSGRVDDTGAGLGEGICLKDSRDDRWRAHAEGNGGRRAKACLSIRLQTRTVRMIRERVPRLKLTRNHELRLHRMYKSN